MSPIKGLKLGMPIEEAVAVMNEKAGPIWAATMGKPSAQPYKVMRIPGENMQQLRLQLIQLMSLATMQLYRVDPADTQDIFIDRQQFPHRLAIGSGVCGRRRILCECRDRRGGEEGGKRAVREGRRGHGRRFACSARRCKRHEHGQATVNSQATR